MLIYFEMNPTIKTIIFFSILTIILIGLGYLLGGTSLAITFFMLALIADVVMFWFSDKLALAMAGAQELKREQIPGLFDDVQELSGKMGIPMPRIYIANHMQPNAFATGRDPKHSAVCVTQGLLQILNREQIRAVLAHELAHIKNRDVLIVTIASVIASAISSVAQLGFYFGEDEDRNPITSILTIVIAPIAALILQLAISRQREFTADETGAKAIGRPKDLADALVIIENVVMQIPMNVSPAMSSLFIQNPFTRSGIMELFSTHPSTESRVKRLLNIEV